MPTSGYEFVSVPRKSVNAGRPAGKKKYIILFRWADVATYERDEKGVNVTGLSLQTGKKPIGVYATSSSVNVYHTSEGDEDARGFIHHVDFEHPGSTLEFDEFVNNNINEQLGAIVVDCGADEALIAGTPCAPLGISQDNSENSASANKHTVNLTSTQRGPALGHMATSLIPATDNADVNAEMGLTGNS